MKTNLVKFLALSSMVLALGACTGQQHGGEQSSSGTDVSSETSSSGEEVAQVVTITELLELDANYNFALEGKLVTIEHLALQGRYANTIIGGTALGKGVTTLRGLQIDCAEFPTFQKGSGWGADISATGRVKNVNGRAVLDNAEVTVNSERDYDNPPADGSSPYSGGLSISYWPAAAMDRGAFDTYLGRGMSGIMFAGVFQLASLPEVVSTEQGTSFQVVFPGEYADVDDLENMSLITVNVPDGIGQTGVTKFNTFFEGKAVGDFVEITGLGEYDLVKNGGYGILLETFAAQDCAVPNPLPAVYTQWAQVAAVAQGYYAAELPDLSNEKTFTYKVNTDYVTYGVEQLFDDASFVKVDHDEAVFVEFDLISKPSDVETVFNEAVADLKAAGFTEDQAGEGAAILVKYENEVAVAQADVFNQDSYVEVDYMALPLETEFATFAEAKEFYEGRAGRFVTGFASALIDSNPSAVSYEVDISTETLLFDKYDDEIYIYDFYLTLETANEDAADEYAAALIATGFEAKRLSGYGVDGYFNATTNEFLAEWDMDDEANKVVYFELLVLSDDAVADYIIDVPAGVDLATALTQANAAIPADIQTITGAASTYQVSFGAILQAQDENVEYYIFDGSSALVNAGVYDTYGLIAPYTFELHLADGVNYATVGNALMSALDTAGWVYGQFTLLSANGFLNQTTNEFVRVSATAEDTIVVSLIMLDATSAAYFTAAE